MTKKRSSPDDNADPTEFINQYFERRGIKVTEDSGANKDCVRRAEEAREAYKRMRSSAAQDVSSVRGDAPAGLDADVLTPAQKYNRRLVNNRKSAAAARVYQEVLKREQSNMLRSVEEERDKCLHERDRALEERDRIAQEKDHFVQTAKQVSRERDHMASEIERLNRDLAFLRQQVSLSRRSVDGMNNTVRKVYSQSQSQSQSQSMPMSAPMPASQELMERKDEISPSKAQMPSAVRSVLPGPFTFSSSGSQGEEMKLFPGLNSQSQPEESEDKGGLFMRPTGAALQAGVLHSQLSQDVGAMRCSLGSAEDVGHPDPNFFLTQSFPTDKSVAAT